MQNHSNQRILVVDDEETMREILFRILDAEGYSCRTVDSGQGAIDILRQETFALVISDINMPGMTGIELLHSIQQSFQDLAVIMVTAVDDRNVAVQTLELGAYDYVIKPFNRNEICISVANALRLRRLEIDNRRYSRELEALVEDRTRELRSSQEETILRLAKATEFRDNETAQHTVRMSHYCKLLAKKAGIPAALCERIRMASPLHDVGKVGISDTVLLKPGKLTAEEFETIKGHAEIGYRILSDSNSELLQLAAIIAWTHHEKYDGSGYPSGLAGEEIPVEGRIAAICDVFDALTSDRVYKKAMPTDEAFELLSTEKGKHFDPDLLDLFLTSKEEILSIRQAFADG